MPESAARVFHGEIFDVYQWEETGYDGRKMTFERLIRPDTVSVIAVTEDGKILMNRESQPASPEFISLPGGRVDAGEDALDGAKRELLEETGYSSNDWELFSSDQPVHKIEWAVFIFIARNCKKTAEQKLDGGEKITTSLLDFDEFYSVIVGGSSTSSDYSQLKVMLLEAKNDPQKMAEFKKRLGLK